MSTSAIYVLDAKGKVLISRNYRGDMDLSVIDKFMPLLMEKEEEGVCISKFPSSFVTHLFVFPLQASSLP